MQTKRMYIHAKEAILSINHGAVDEEFFKRGFSKKTPRIKKLPTASCFMAKINLRDFLKR